MPQPPHQQPGEQFRQPSARRRERLRRDDGGIAVYTAICTIALLGIIGLAIDGGGKLRATERADAVAMEAARAAGQAIDPAAAVTGEGVRADPEAAQAAAYAYLARAGHQGSVTLSADRTQLTVTVNGSYPTKFLSVVGIGSMSVSGHGSARLLHGVTAPQ
ncbi:pilus assembly protein TadG-related protein [Streptomyces sp. NPDC059447]|uniref:pilus assembly protein TadG-related protein n=1 Tax=Streptomyces sp. NPDC059447 TaxID=3346834 RepID=UPI0036C53C8A